MNYPTCGHAIAPSYWNYKDSHGQPLFILRISVFFFKKVYNWNMQISALSYIIKSLKSRGLYSKKIKFKGSGTLN